jgi:aldose 1-epimerase
MHFRPLPALGEQYELTLEAAGRSVRAVIAEVAAAIRHLSVDGVEVTAGDDDDAPPPFECGIVLVPWPNRVRDGRWTHDGRTLQLDITEPERGNALHGLLRNTPYQLVERSECSVTLEAQVFPQNGYPFHLDTRVRYTPRRRRHPGRAHRAEPLARQSRSAPTPSSRSGMCPQTRSP